MFAVGCGQSEQVKVTYKSDPPGGVLYKQNGDLYVIPVGIAGSFVQVEGCNERKIKLVQVECGDIGKGIGDFPCYKDCERIKIRANFEVKLGLKKEKIGDVIKYWQAYFSRDAIVDASGNWNEIVICVEAWKAKLYENARGTQAKVGEVTISVKPSV
jgi:hypothetical protein